MCVCVGGECVGVCASVHACRQAVRKERDGSRGSWAIICLVPRVSPAPQIETKKSWNEAKKLECRI